MDLCISHSFKSNIYDNEKKVKALNRYSVIIKYKESMSAGAKLGSNEASP